MDRAKVKALLESGVLQAYADGKTIQMDRGYYLNLTNRQWEDVGSPTLTFQMPASCYRVKPEPRHDWVVEFGINNAKIFYAKTETEIKQISGWYDYAPYRQLVPVTEEN